MTTTSDLAARTDGDALVERASALVPLLRANPARTEKGRRVVEENIEALTEAGLFRLTVPKRLGGHEADLRTFLRVSSELARGCGSTAWVATLVNVSNRVVGLMPERAQRDVWGENPDARCCGVPAPSATSRKVEGGQVITGRWGFASGSLHPQWAPLGFPLMDADGQQIDQASALIPIEDLTIEDTWYVAGMRGTGSNTLIADEVFVPDHRIRSVTQAAQGVYGTEHKDEALYRSALIPVLALVLTGPQVGLAKGPVPRSSSTRSPSGSVASAGAASVGRPARPSGAGLARAAAGPRDGHGQVASRWPDRRPGWGRRAGEPGEARVSATSTRRRDCRRRPGSRKAPVAGQSNGSPTLWTAGPSSPAARSGRRRPPHA